MGIAAETSNIVLDGRNVVKGKDKAILCNKVFKENPHYDERALIKKLEEIFQASKIIFLPTDKDGFMDHADGMVRFINDDTVLINEYTNESSEFQLGVRLALYNAGLKTIELPYNPYSNSATDDASGIYINYLEMNGLVIAPTFKIIEDDEAIILLKEVFPTKKILSIDSSEIAKQGGILDCISWNIKSNKRRTNCTSKC